MTQLSHFYPTLNRFFPVFSSQLHFYSQRRPAATEPRAAILKEPLHANETGGRDNVLVIACISINVCLVSLGRGAACRIVRWDLPLNTGYWFVLLVSHRVSWQCVNVWILIACKGCLQSWESLSAFDLVQQIDLEANNSQSFLSNPRITAEDTSESSVPNLFAV